MYCHNMKQCTYFETYIGYIHLTHHEKGSICPHLGEISPKNVWKHIIVRPNLIFKWWLRPSAFLNRVLGLWGLTPLSTIFQLYRGLFNRSNIQKKVYIWQLCVSKLKYILYNAQDYSVLFDVAAHRVIGKGWHITSMLAWQHHFNKKGYLAP